MYWIFVIPLLLCLFAIYMEFRTRKAYSRFIDVRTGKPVPVASGYFESLYYLLRSRIDIPMAERVKGLGLKYGPYYAVTSIFPTIVIADPEDVKTVLKKIDEFPKRPPIAKLEFMIKPMIGPKNIAALNNPEWHDQRTLLNKPFSTNTVFFEPVCKKVDLVVSKWEDQSEVYVGHDLQKMTLDALASCIFGLEFDTLNGKLSAPLNAYNVVIERLFNPLRFIFPTLNKIPIPFNTHLFQNLEVFDKYCWEIMDQTKKMQEKKNQSNTEQPDDKTLSLIELMYKSGVDENTIRDNVSLFFLAGHETTATALSWMLSILVTYPEVQEKARKEIFERVPNDITLDSLKELPYIDALIKEGLRMYPPAPQIGGRYVLKDTVLGNVRIPANTSIDVNFISMAHDPKIWGDPSVCRPERWFPENVTKEQRAAWMPFSTGARVCIGMNFSLFEQKIFLIYLLKRYSSIKLSPQGKIKPKIGGFLYAPDFDSLILQFVK